MKRLLVLTLMVAILLSGCSGQPVAEVNPIQAPEPPSDAMVVEEPCEPVTEQYTLRATPIPSEPEPEPVEPIEENEKDKEPLVVSAEPSTTRTWISPGKVEVGNFHAGARAEWVMTINNGLDTNMQQYKVITGAGENTATFELEYPLYNNSMEFMMEVASSIKEETDLKVVGYDAEKKTIAIGGFLDNRERIVALTYQYGVDREFHVNYEPPHHLQKPYEMPPENARDWVIIADNTIVLAPEHRADVLVVLDMPEGESAPPKWEFWVLVTRKTGATVETNLATRWLVSMRVEE